MASEFYSIAELIGLPGMPSSRQGALKLLKRGKVQSRSKEKGKGQEYHIDSLPPETQAFLAKKKAEKIGHESPDFLAGKALAEQMKRAEQQTKE